MGGIAPAVTRTRSPKFVTVIELFCLVFSLVVFMFAPIGRRREATIISNAQSARQSSAAVNATMQRTRRCDRLSRAWPLDHGRLLAPSGTVIDSNSDDEWS